MFPDRDAYILRLDGCTFFIERDRLSQWLLSYRTSSGHYHFRRCPTPRDCAALLAEPDEDNQDWLTLKQRVRSLVLPENALDLSTWIGVADAPPQ